MEFKQLIYFIQLCNDKTFSKAASNLFLTHQGLNKAIRNLEVELEASLYYKDRHEIVLTEAGEELYRQSKVLLSELDSLRKKMTAYSEAGKNKVVKIASAYAVYGELYSICFAGLKEAFPKIQFEFFEYPDLLCEKAVLNEDADIGFTIGPFEQENLTAIPLKTYNLCALVNLKHHLSSYEKLFCKNLKDEKIVIANDNFKIYHSFLNQCLFSGFKPNIIFKGSEITSIHSLSCANKGIAITVDLFDNYPECRTIPFEIGTLNWTIGMIVKKNRVLNQPARDTIRYINRIIK